MTASPDQSLHPALRKAEIDGMKSQLADLLEELEEYESVSMVQAMSLLTLS